MTLTLNRPVAKPRHWAVKYIGRPYRPTARGPKEYDCWGLFWRVYRDEFGIYLPFHGNITLGTIMEQCHAITKGLSDWVKIAKPEDGCGVAMSQRDTIHHVGIWLNDDGGRILHAYEKTGVIASRVRDLQLRGFKRIDFYRHNAWSIS